MRNISVIGVLIMFPLKILKKGGINETPRAEAFPLAVFPVFQPPGSPGVS